MKLLRPRLLLRVHGDLDDIRLEYLVNALSLVSAGKSTDPVGTLLGRRTVPHPRYPTVSAVTVAVIRSAVDEWTVALDTVPTQEFDEWASLVETATVSAGLTVEVQEVPAPPPPERSAATFRYQAAPAPARIRIPIVTDDDLIALATGLHDHEWSWRMDDLLGISPAMLFWEIRRADPDLVVFDAPGLPGECLMHGHDFRVDRIDVPVADLSIDDRVEPEFLDRLFGFMAATLTGRFGRPDDEAPGTRIRWTGVRNTIELAKRTASIHVVLEPIRGTEYTRRRQLLPIAIYREMYTPTRRHLPSLRNSFTQTPIVDRSNVATYMRSGRVIHPHTETVSDIMNPSYGIAEGRALLSDGHWIWRGDSIHYTANYPIGIPDEFLEHVRAHNYYMIETEITADLRDSAVTHYS